MDIGKFHKEASAEKDLFLGDIHIIANNSKADLDKWAGS